MWKVTLAWPVSPLKGVVWVEVGNQCPFLPLLGGSWKNSLSQFQLVWHQHISGVNQCIKSTPVDCDWRRRSREALVIIKYDAAESSRAAIDIQIMSL